MESQKTRSLVKLHPDAKEISFEHIYTIQDVFKKNISPLLGIDYFSLMLVDSHNVLTIYSNRPSLEFNLIANEIWIHDGIFYLDNHRDNMFYFWDELYSDAMRTLLTQEKEKKYGFEFGFFLTKRINDIFVIYSFATKRKESRELYKASTDILYNIGDYFFYALGSIHKKYLSKGYLKLIIDNTKKEILL